MPTLPITAINEIANIIGQSRSAFEAVMRLQYAPAWDHWVHTESNVLSSKIAKKKGEMMGQMKIGLVTTGLPQSAGISTGERYRLPTPSVGSHLNPRVVARDFVSRLRWTGQVRRAARRGQKAAWRRPQQQDLEDARLQSGLNWATKMWNGYVDVRDRVTAGATKTSATEWTLTMDARNSRLGGNSDLTDRYIAGNHYLREQMAVGVVDASAGTNSPEYSPSSVNNNEANELYISAIDNSTPATPTITVKPRDGVTPIATALNLADVAAGDMIIPYASRQDNVGSAYAANSARDTQFFTFNGVDSIVADSTGYSSLYGLLKTATTKLEGVRDDGANDVQRVWTERLLTFMIHRIRNEGTGGRPDCAMMHDSVLREVVDENRGARQFEEVQRNSGYSSQLMHTAGDTRTPYMPDWLCPAGGMAVLDSRCFGWYSEADMESDPETRWVADYDQYEQIWHKSGNEECTKPHNNGRIENLTFSTTALT